MSITDAKAQLTDLVRRAEAGDDVVLTRHGRPAARLVAIREIATPQQRRAVLGAVRKAAAGKATAGADAARSQDFLYDADTGLPR
ncbi:MAG TPA: type II toxin-antitoxin system prevent-host-death family antitoxin [Allosphingosinicella sp.]|nr:type II toxin-antitoxin system prevent-host-death family antitoxin [Allosphingosinicella sp.]